MKHVITKFESQLSRLSNEELVTRFNREIGNNGWVSARAYFLLAIRNQFEYRAIDYSIVRNESGGFKLDAKVVLKDGKLIF